MCSCSRCMRKWRFPSGKQPSRGFNSSLKGRGAAQQPLKSQPAQLQLLGEARPQGWRWRPGQLGSLLLSAREEKERGVKGTLELSLRSVSKYLPSLSALGQGPVKDAQKSLLCPCPLSPQEHRGTYSPVIAAGRWLRKASKTGRPLMRASE